MKNVHNLVVSVWYAEFIQQDVADEDRDFGVVTHLSDGAWIDEMGSELKWQEFHLINEIHPAAQIPTMEEEIEAHFDGYKFTVDNIPWSLLMVA